MTLIKPFIMSHVILDVRHVTVILQLVIQLVVLSLLRRRLFQAIDTEVPTVNELLQRGCALAMNAHFREHIMVERITQFQLTLVVLVQQP